MASQLANHLRALYSAKKKDKLRGLYTATSHHRIPSPQTGTQLAFLLGAGRLASDVPPLSSPSSSASAPSSSNSNELSRFTGTWWDYEGPWKQMHSLNPPRLAFICSALCRHFGRDPSSPRPFEGLKFVDVGCGGGIVSEPLARMGAAVTGVDITEEYVESARDHADLDPSTSTIEYCWATAEMLVEEQRTFDAVISLQVVEYAADPAEFCKSLATLAVPNGAIVIATTNRSMATYVTAVISAMRNPNWAPPTPFSGLLTPEELALILKQVSVSVKEMAGYAYNALTGRWFLSDDISGNFIAFGTKNSQ